MAASQTKLFLLFPMLLLITLSNFEAYGNAKLHPSNCKPRCTYRCSAASHKSCMFFYAKCHCFRSGTYGNKQVCPCYNKEDPGSH
ncbi:hypothetical protein DITRI_Ditri19aG0014000 [Diplodiscus trichospermus]